MRRVEARRAEMRLYDLVLAALLMGIGFVLHAIFPGIFGGMKPDFSLIMLFIIIMMIADKKVGVIAGLVTGILTALTTTFPNGQIPNVVDKIVVTAAVTAMTYFIPRKFLVPIVGIFGTLISGTVFLTTAALLSGLPQTFGSLMLVVVLPTTAINTLVLILLYPIACRFYPNIAAGTK